MRLVAPCFFSNSGIRDPDPNFPLMLLSSVDETLEVSIKELADAIVKAMDFQGEYSVRCSPSARHIIRDDHFFDAIVVQK